ncbi:GNAT family N-acetyltransferase [Arthrobacter sp. H14]|uniref:GNAT family N-acetyltransferase n=1 Tax=Arthrobacter sp. H14 TaxID=1312959 RepID=UPI000479240E|nr:GNAT family N-acetyltransferase [Arthrobacter sp. H14]
MAVLTVPAVTWHRAWLEAHEEWGPGLHEDGFGLLPDDDTRSAVGFTSWVRRLSDDERCSYWWITDGEQILGGIALRHASNPLVPRAGHVGYGIRSSARGRGLASWAVALMVEEAHILGIDRVLAVCESDNIASAKTIERQGGVLDEASKESTVLRYWIETTPPYG